MDEFEDYVPLSSLNAFCYCPHRVYLEYVQGAWDDNIHTIKGTLEHETVHDGRKRVDRAQFRQVNVRSDVYKLLGKIDVVEFKDGLFVPVEYKKGRKGKWYNDQVQVCAQGLCLEEQLETEIDYGFLWYFGSKRREKVNFTPKLKEETIRVSREVHDIYRLKKKTFPDYTKKCNDCSIKSICLPLEIKLLKKGR